MTTSTMLLNDRNSFDLLEQQVCYTGELLFWCGDPRTHEEALDHLNYSLWIIGVI